MIALPNGRLDGTLDLGALLARRHLSALREHIAALGKDSRSTRVPAAVALRSCRSLGHCEFCERHWRGRRKIRHRNSSIPLGIDESSPTSSEAGARVSRACPDGNATPRRLVASHGGQISVILRDLDRCYGLRQISRAVGLLQRTPADLRNSRRYSAGSRSSTSRDRQRAAQCSGVARTSRDPLARI